MSVVVMTVARKVSGMKESTRRRGFLAVSSDIVSRGTICGDVARQ